MYFTNVFFFFSNIFLGVVRSGSSASLVKLLIVEIEYRKVTSMRIGEKAAGTGFRSEVLWGVEVGV